MGGMWGGWEGGRQEGSGEHQGMEWNGMECLYTHEY